MQRILLISGCLLLLFGLLVGTALNAFASHAVAVDLHVAGVQHGMLIILVGLAWGYASLARLEPLCAGAMVIGLYGIWIAFLIGAVSGEIYPAASQLTNITFVISSWVSIAGIAVFLYGLVNGHKAG